MTQLDPTSRDLTWRPGRPERLMEALAHEIAIEWKEDIETFDYVRQAVVYTRTRKGHVRCPNPYIGRTVGYGVLNPLLTAWDFGFARRVFWVKDYDRSENPDGIYAADCPFEAVDPRTVEAGQPGYVTIRARRRTPDTPVQTPAERRALSTA